MATLALSERAGYYTYEETAKLLCISYQHLLRVIGFGVFHPTRLGDGARKYLLKSEVDAKVGEILYSLRRPKTVQKQLQPETRHKKQKFVYSVHAAIFVESEEPLSNEDLMEHVGVYGTPISADQFNTLVAS